MRTSTEGVGGVCELGWSRWLGGGDYIGGRLGVFPLPLPLEWRYSVCVAIVLLQ